MDVLALDEQPEVPEGLQSADRFVHYTFDGVAKQAAWLPLSNGMHLYVTVPVREINADWHTWSLEVAASFAVLLSAAIFVVMSFVGRITLPLRRLTKAAEQIGEGNYDCDLSYDGNDEVGVLTETFKNLTAYLREHISELSDRAYVDALTGVRNRMALRHDYGVSVGHI